MEINQMGLVPLRNFAQVVPGVYRSAQPMYSYEYNWLKQYPGIKTIVNLRDDSHRDDNFSLRRFNVITLDIPDHHCPNEEQQRTFNAILNDPSNYPILIHCEHGHGRTSTFSCLTKINKGMTPEQAVVDEASRFHYEFRHPKQKEFILNLK